MDEMNEFRGTYIGFSPTDESDVGFGELEITIDERLLKFRMATGLEIRKEEIPIDDLMPMTPEEAAAIWQKDTPGDIASRTIGFKGSSESPQFFFIKDPKEDEFGILVRIGMGDILGPTILFSPSQVGSGRHEKFFLAVEQKFGRSGVIPRLKNNGRAEVV